jgi:uncharacterized protein YjbI with pentapeptide repeats
MIELYKKSLITIEQANSSILGFFVSANTIVTCRHGINWEKTNEIKFKDYNSKLIDTTFKIRAENSEDCFDFVVLEFAGYSSDYAVHLNSKVSPNDRLFSKGRTREFKESDSATPSAVEWVEATPGCKILKFVDGYIEPGYSGSPLLNLDTGSVCGHITDRKGLESGESGGYATGIDSVYSFLPDLRAKNAAFHLGKTEWFEKNQLRKKGIGLYDQTFENRYHSKVFNFSEFSVDDVYIPPQFETRSGNSRITPDLSKGSLHKITTDLFSEQNILFIFGQYGVGKTLLSKQIQRELLLAGEDCLFVRAGRFYDTREGEIWDLVTQRKLNEFLYVIIDTFDEVYSLDNPAVLNPALRAFLEASIKDPSIRIVINSRNIRIDLSDTLNNIDGLFREYGIDGVKNVIVLDYFSKPKIDEWLDNYRYLFEPDELIPELFKDKLNEIHKELLISCKNPLLLFLLVTSFKNKEFAALNDIYTVLGNFVSRTIDGKLDYGRSLTNLGQTIIPLYRDLLKKIARAINKQIEDSGDPNLYKFVFDNNTRQYEIEDRYVRDLISEEKEKILAELSKIDKINSESLVSKTFNNYFFEFNNNKWKYRDNNILFYLLAEDYFTELFHAIDGFENNLDHEAAYAYLSEKLVHTPKIEFIELLIFKCLSLDNAEKKRVTYLLETFFSEGHVLNLTERNLQEISLRKLKLDIVLIILYLQLNKAGYSKIEYFFSRLAWAVSAIKTLDKDLKFLVKRFFRNTTISNAVIKRVDLTGYNFDFGNFKKTRFVQDSLNDSRCNSAIFEEVDFELCEIRDGEFIDFSGDINFRDCHLRNLRISPKQGENCRIVFRRCFLQNLRIFGSESGAYNGRKLQLILEDSFVDTINFRRLEINPFNLNNCFYNRLTFHSVQGKGEYSSQFKPKFKADELLNSRINLVEK